MSKSPERKVKPGRAIDRSDEQLDRLAEVSDSDLDRALADATDDMRALLEAEGDDEA